MQRTREIRSWGGQEGALGSSAQLPFFCEVFQVEVNTGQWSERITTAVWGEGTVFFIFQMAGVSVNGVQEYRQRSVEQSTICVFGFFNQMVCKKCEYHG